MIQLIIHHTQQCCLRFSITAADCNNAIMTSGRIGEYSLTDLICCESFIFNILSVEQQQFYVLCKMAEGFVIENLSTRKLSVFCALLLITLVIILCIGGLVAPRPSMAMNQEATNCVRNQNQMSKDDLFLPKTCTSVSSLGSDAGKVEPDQIVFSSLIPHYPQEMSPWFQYLLTILHPTISFQKHNQVGSNPSLLLDITIAYSNEDDPRTNPDAWTILSHCQEVRKLECTFPHDKNNPEVEGFTYDCEVMHLFQLGSIPHKFYLVNMKMPIHETSMEGAIVKGYNTDIGNWESVHFVSITQTGGFTQVWLCLKSVVAVLIFIPIVWFWKRIRQLDRKPELMEKSIMVLAMSMWFLDIPFEYFCIFFEVPWMLFFIDIRQGGFYTVLLSFWVIFIGEHLMDQAHRNKLSNYKYQLSAITIGSCALLAFDVAERGYQMVNPCSTIWNTPNVAHSFLITAVIMGVLYFILLLYLVFRVFRSISHKARFSLNPQQQAKFRKTVNRFRALMILTVATAALTVVMYNLTQTLEGALQFNGKQVEVSSAFFTGVYGLWNIYVFLVLSMYAPSHKKYKETEENTMDSRQELIQLSVSEQQRLLQATQEVKERED